MAIAVTDEALGVFFLARGTFVGFPPFQWAASSRARGSTRKHGCWGVLVVLCVVARVGTVTVVCGGFGVHLIGVSGRGRTFLVGLGVFGLGGVERCVL